MDTRWAIAFKNILHALRKFGIFTSAHLEINGIKDIYFIEFDVSNFSIAIPNEKSSKRSEVQSHLLTHVSFEQNKWQDDFSVQDIFCIETSNGREVEGDVLDQMILSVK